MSFAGVLELKRLRFLRRQINELKKNKNLILFGMQTFMAAQLKTDACSGM